MAESKTNPEDLLENLLDSKLMDSLQQKIMEAIRPTLVLIVKSLIAPLRDELIQSAKDASTAVANEKMESVSLTVKKLTQENNILKLRVEASECAANRSSLIFAGLNESSNLGMQRDQQQIDGEIVARFLSENLGISITETDISNSYRITNKKAGVCRALVVSFTSRRIRDRIYRARKQLRNGSSLVYVNELLTKQSARLFALARQLVKRKLIFRTWTMDGAVMVRVNDEITIKPIRIQDVSALRIYDPDIG